MQAIQDRKATFTITAYTQSSIVIDDKSYDQHHLIHPTKGVQVSPANTFDALTIKHIDSIRTLDPDVKILLVDCGKKQRWLQPEIIRYAEQQKIAIQSMTQPAIFRQYSLLANDQQDVIALVFLTDTPSL